MAPHPSTTHGAWSSVADATAAGGNLHESDIAAARSTLTFTGRDVAWVAERGPSHGKAKVYVDGKQVGTVDLAATTDHARQVVFTWHAKSVGTYHLRIVVNGTAGRPTVGVDGFLVLR